MIYEWRTPLNLVAKAYFAWRRNAVVEMGERLEEIPIRALVFVWERRIDPRKQTEVSWPGRDAAAADDFDLAKYVTCSALGGLLPQFIVEIRRLCFRPLMLQQ